MGLLQATDLGISIAGKTVCRDLSFAIERGQLWGLLGRNGVGKTTLLHTLAGLRLPDAGQLSLDGDDLIKLPRRRVARRLGVLFQDSTDTFPATVLETALTGRHPHLRLWQWEDERERTIARQALIEMELRDMESRLASTLSGGERRRLAVACLLAQDPALFLLDEPTNHLDLPHQIGILGRFRDLALQQQRGVLMTLHDVNLALRFCTHVLLLFGDGQTLHGDAESVLNPEVLERLYGHPMRLVADGDLRAYVAG